MDTFSSTPAERELAVGRESVVHGNLVRLNAHWVSRDLILWEGTREALNSYHLLYDPAAKIVISQGKLTGGLELPLTYTAQDIPLVIRERFPHLAGLCMFKLQPEDLVKVPAILKGQAIVMAQDPTGKVIDASGLQIPGVLDDLFFYPGKLGVSFEKGAPVLRVWAPTARSIDLLLFADGRENTRPEQLPMTFNPASGVWSIKGKRSWKGKYYLYQVNGYVTKQRGLVTSRVTDPYSVSLSTNSQRSQIVDLADPSLAPKGWRRLVKPPLAAPEDIVLYELHVRDFSAYSTAIPAQERGSYKAFTRLDSPGMKHLKALAQAGLTHVHLLPVFDSASINEARSTWKPPDPLELAKYPPASPKQQELVWQTRDADGYNWGYDPYHYNVPEGSYATYPDGASRILEFREMVKALNSLGLRVVMDVVYNHTYASGLSDKSVLDKIVPGYYHRLNGNGEIESSTCCQNTATENRMMEKLMIDSLVQWSTAYKVDGFRFDLMGHHMLSNLTNARLALDGLTLEKDGLEGKRIYLYGEGWNFGELANNARGINATQLNTGGMGIGVFNDRLRDAVRGGGAFGGLQEQGFITGLLNAPNAVDQGSQEAVRHRLLKYTDWIKISLAGNLKDYRLVDLFGWNVSGAEIDYNGQPAGYTQDPQENILYVSAHDNETLFDAIQLKAPLTDTLAQRGRRQTLGLSLVLLGQGVPFIHAGDEILRSKSFDRNSYASGDWFNHIDYTLETNNYGIGLPPAGDNRERWSLVAPLLADANMKPNKSDLAASLARFKEFLAIRKSSTLFRLRNRDAVCQCLTFANNGPDQTPGVIAMNLRKLPEFGLETAPDSNYTLICVIFNANEHEVTVVQSGLTGVQLALHPVQANSSDAVVRESSFDPTGGVFHVPGLTTAVFVAR